LQAATVAVLALGAATAKVIQIGADFEKTLVTAAVKFPGKIRQGSEAFKELEDVARKTGAQTEFTATQAAEGLNFLAMAGFDAEQAIAALPGVVDLATAAAVELGEASDMATDTLGAFGLMTEDTAKLGLNLARVNDVMAATTTSANTNMEQMFEAIKGGGPVVHAAGQDIETFSTLVGTMADSGIKGEKAGVILKNMFLKLQAPVGKAKGLIKKYAGNILDAKGDMIDIVEIMRRFEKSTGKLGKAQRAQIMDAIFGKRAIVGTSVLLEAGADKMDKYRESIEAASGTSREMASVIRDTTMGSLNALKSVVESLIIDLFKLEDKGIKETIEGITKWIRENKKLIASKVGEFIKDLIKKFKEFVAWAKKVELIEKLKDAFTLFGKAIALLPRPWKS
jgi:TP901 family phage tail tape measure protein